jgi:hypothetical protein
MEILSQFSTLRRWSNWWGLLLAGMLMSATSPLWGQGTSREYDVKAVFLFNFVQFTEWPTNAFAAANSPLVIGVLGKDPFNSALENTVKGETINGRTLKVQRFARVEEVRDCQLLYVSASEASRSAHIVEVLKNRPVLTVGETDGFVLGGGCIRFVNENSKIRLRINLGSVKRANLTISSKLLRLAEIVASEKD